MTSHDAVKVGAMFIEELTGRRRTRPGAATTRALSARCTDSVPYRCAAFINSEP